MGKINKMTLIKITVLILFSGLICSVNAAEKSTETKEEPKKITVEKTLNGEVSGISPNFIAILYGQDKKTSYEMALVMDKNTKVEHKNSLKEIAAGDIVSVRYEEITQVFKQRTEKGEEKDVVKVLGRLVKVVSFVRSPAKGLQSSEEFIPVIEEKPQEETVNEVKSQEGESQE